MFRTTRCLALVIAVLALAQPAFAQDPEAPPEPPVDASRDEEARSLFQAGSSALSAGRFADALDHFERSYELSRRPALLYNIGLTASTLGNLDRAIAAFEQFLREDPLTGRRQEVEGRLRTLEERRRRASPTPVAPVESHGPGVGPWIVIGASGAAVLGGVVLFAVGLGANSDVESSADGTAWPEVSGDYDRGKLFTTLGAILGAVGIAGAAAGVVWLVVGSGESGERNVQVSAGLGGVSIGGTF